METGALRILHPVALREGAGVRIRRFIGTPPLRHLDPFLLLDYFDSDTPADYLAGFPEHPHRGFCTLTVMLNGCMRHRDNLGHEGVVAGGGLQWMKAARGVIHSEMPAQRAGRLRGFQLWINLPAARKMDPPDYRDHPPESVPEVAAGGTRWRILAGAWDGVPGPLQDPDTDLQLLDVRLAPGASWAAPAGADRATFTVVYEGTVEVGGRALPGPAMVLGRDAPLLTAARTGAAREGARLLAAGARPLGEPIVQYGPFVMNTRAEIEQALADYRAGRLAGPEPFG